MQSTCVSWYSAPILPGFTSAVHMCTAWAVSSVNTTATVLALTASCTGHCTTATNSAGSATGPTARGCTVVEFMNNENTQPVYSSVITQMSALCWMGFERTNERTVLIQEQSPYKRKDRDRRTDRDRRDRQSDNIYKQFNTVTTTTNRPNTSYTTLDFTSSKLTTNKFCEEHKLTRKTHCALCITLSYMTPILVDLWRFWATWTPAKRRDYTFGPIVSVSLTITFESLGSSFCSRGKSLGNRPTGRHVPVIGSRSLLLVKFECSTGVLGYSGRMVRPPFWQVTGSDDAKLNGRDPATPTLKWEHDYTTAAEASAFGHWGASHTGKFHAL